MEGSGSVPVSLTNNPDTGGPNTYESYGSGTLVPTAAKKQKSEVFFTYSCSMEISLHFRNRSGYRSGRLVTR
jgi:hypothetical protein